MTLDRLWAGWRTTYLNAVTTDDTSLRPDADGRSLFERLFAAEEPDERTHIVWRGDTCFAILNAYPYGSGHVLVLPQRAVPELEQLTPAEHTELWGAVTAAVTAIRTAYAPDGVNVGLNLGRGAGAGVPDHLHVHCLPALDRRLELHDCHRRDPGAARAARRHLAEAPRRLAPVGRSSAAPGSRRPLRGGCLL